MNILKKLKSLWHFSLIKSIYFNFHYLPFKQAVKLPILLRKPKFYKMKGEVRLEFDEGQPIKTGIIQLGTNACHAYPDLGINYENAGGIIIFRGRVDIGNMSALCVGKHGVLDFGHDFKNAGALRIVCYHKITFEPWVRLGWDITVMDSDMHSMFNLRRNGKRTRGFAPIYIGEGSWVGTRSMIMKGTVLPPHTTVAGGSKTGKAYDVPSDCIIGVSKDLDILVEGMHRDIEHADDFIEYPPIEK